MSRVTGSIGALDFLYNRPEVSFCHWVPLICFVLWQLRALFFSYRIPHCLVNGFVAVFLS